MRSILAILALTAAVCHCQDVNIQKNHESLTTRVGDEVDLVCTANVEKQSCSFQPPQGGRSFPVLDNTNVKYLNGRAVANQDSPNKCGIKITSVKEEDNGEWKCLVGVIEDGNFRQGEGVISVTVGIPPERVFMRVNGEEIDGDELVVSKKDENQEVSVECIAQGARPRPNFKWFIGENTADVDAHFEDYEENVDANGKGDYIQSMKYFAAAKHNGKELRCEVQHMGYSEAQKQNGDNIVEKYLEVYFKPQSKNKEQNFYGLHEGQPAQIKVKFEANPKPNNGHWTMHGSDQVIVFGSQSLDGKYTSGFVEDEEATSEYSVTLNIDKVTPEMAGKVNKVIVTNDQGTMEYPFKLELGEKPPSESMGSGPVIGVIVVVVIILLIVIIAVVARSKGILCFAGQKRSDDREGAMEKEGDTESAEDANANAKSAADEPRSKPETENNSEKKSVKAKVNNIFAAVKKSVAKKEGGNEAKMQDKTDLEAGKEDLTYADLDKSAMEANGTHTNATVEDEKTEYAEIQTQKK